MLDLFLLYLVAHKKAVQLINQHFLSVYFWFFNKTIIKRKLFKIIHVITFGQYCHIYTLQMFNLDHIVNNNNEEHNEKWPYIPDHP